MKKEPFTDTNKKGFFNFGILTAISLVGYGLSYLIVMPEVNPDKFVPSELGNAAGSPSWFGPILAVFILLYAFSFMPISVYFTIKQYRVSPQALVFACCLLGISLIIETINNLPILAASIYPGQLASISPDILLYLKQIETVRYLSFDITGFSLAYIAIFIYAIVYFKAHKLLAYLVFGSIVLFLTSFACLWFAPNAAVVMMAISVFAFSAVPVILMRMVNRHGFQNLETSPNVVLLDKEYIT
jgi:hypothetical protein